MRRAARSGLSLLLCASLPFAGCRLTPAPAPRPGRPSFEAPGVLAVPGGLYSVPARNLMLLRRDLSVDTRVRADLTLDATWNSASRRWHWAYETSFDGETFVDPEGARHAIGDLPDGRAVPGTHWVRIDATHVKTKGGLVLGFDAEGRLDSSYWLSDPYPRLRWSRLPARIELRECVAPSLPLEQCRRVYTLELGAHGPLRAVDEESARAGGVREVRYQWQGDRLVRARSAFEVDRGLPGTRYEYATGGLVTALATSEGERVEYHWLFGWLWRIARRGEGDPAHTFSYPARVEGQPGVYRVLHTGPLGGRTRFTFDDGGHVLAIERLDSGERLDIAWDAALHRPVQLVGFDGAVRRYEDWHDDDAGRVLEPSGNVVTYGYEPDGVDRRDPFARPLRRVDDSLGPVLAIDYDPSGRPERWSNGEGDAIEVEHWSAGGEMASATSPWGERTDFRSYGVHGHWRTAVVGSAPDLAVQRKLDRVGNLRVPAAGLQPGGLLERAYDPERRLAAIEVAAADDAGALAGTGVVAIERRSDGRPLSISRPGGADHQLEYDALGRLVGLRERAGGDWHETRYEYDAEDHPTRIARPNGTSEELDYDVYGRVLERRLLRDGVVEAHARFEYAEGRLDRAYDSVRDQWQSFEYDAAGRPVRSVYSRLGEWLAFEYDLRSRTTRETFAFGPLVRVIETDWDLADRRTRVATRDGQGAVRDLVRPIHAAGRLVAIEYGNGLRREHRFGPDGRFQGYLTTRLADGSLVEDNQLRIERRFDPSRLELVTRSQSDLATTEEVYWLSPGGSPHTAEGLMGARVFRWQARSWVDGLVQHEDERVYAWDELGNRQGAGGDVFVYDAERSRLLAATVDGTSHDYGYDPAGFATLRDGLELAWTAGGRLARVGPASAPLARADWDLAGRPVRVEVLGQLRELALFGGRVELASDGSPGWLHLAHVSLPFVGEERAYRHLDPLGNVGLVSDEAGQVTSHRRYQPFGLDRVYGVDGGSQGHHAGFVGGSELRRDGVGTGLVLLGARVLDSQVGRFLSADPVLQWLSQYAYALGNPVRYQDAGGATPIGKPPVSAADLEWAAAQASLHAAEANAAAADVALKAAVLGVAALVSGGAVPLVVLGGAVGVVSTGFAREATRFELQAAELRAQAAAIRASQAAMAAAPPSVLEPEVRKELILLPDELHPLPDFALPLAPGLAPPPVCGPSAGWGGGPRAAPLLALLCLLASLLWLRRSDPGDGEAHA